ncbi:MAG: LamG-like jellyroll fold domain-containing protein [Desulfuromonadaceae bacterium]
MKNSSNYYTLGLCLKRAFFLCLFVLSFAVPVHAVEPWVGIFFSPQANTNNSHTAFMVDFEAMVKTLKAKGLNTIVFDMNYGAFHFTSDAKLNSYSYSAAKGFTAAEARRMAEIVRANGMQVMVALQVLTHSVGNVYPEVYPEYMLPGKTWQLGTAFKAYDYAQYGGRTYRCVTPHTSAIGNAPPATAYWTATPTDTRDPFNSAGESVVFKMVDELIAAFTVNNIKPEGFHIGSDELGFWYDNPVQATGKSSAQIYASAITSAYNHIKLLNPIMEVIMWGDMLDPKWNGSTVLKNTAVAIDLIPKGLIIADWRYDTSQLFRYESVKAIFPSSGEFLDKGFRVWPTSWSDVKGTTDLVWTGNMEQARTGKVMGHLYSTWLSGIVPGLKSLLDNPNIQIPDSVLPGISESDKTTFRQYYRGLADSINATSNIAGLKQCRGSNYFCGTYPNCEDNTMKDGLYASEFRSYSCNNNVSVYSAISFPNDYVGYWKFDGDATDISSRNSGILMNGAAIINDALRGQVASFLKDGAYVKVKNSDLLNMGTGSLSISIWFKAGTSADLGTLVSKSPNLNNYSLFLHSDGRILLETNSNNFYRYSKSGVNYRDNDWHHAVVLFDSSIPTVNIYVDGMLSNGQSMFLDGGNIKSSTSDMYIGNNNGSGQYEFSGYLDDLMVFNLALSPAQVKLIYTKQVVGPKAPRPTTILKATPLR